MDDYEIPATIRQWLCSHPARELDLLRYLVRFPNTTLPDFSNNDAKNNAKAQRELR